MSFRHHASIRLRVCETTRFKGKASFAAPRNTQGRALAECRRLKGGKMPAQGNALGLAVE